MLVLGAFVVLPIALVAGDGSLLPLIGLLALPLAVGPLRAMTNRTDGPALNGALAGTGALLGAFSLLVSLGLLLAELMRARWMLWRANRLGRGHPLRAALPRALRDRARAGSTGARWCCCGCAPTRPGRARRSGAAVAARRRRAWSRWSSELEGSASATRRESRRSVVRGGAALADALELRRRPLRGADRAARSRAGGARRPPGCGPRRRRRSAATRPWSPASRPRSPRTPNAGPRTASRPSS